MKVGHKIILLISLFWVNITFSQEPFVCDGRYFATTETHLAEIIIDWEMDTFYLVPFENELPRSIDAIGYNPVDNFIYGLSRIGEKNIFYQIDATGQAFPIDTLQFDTQTWNPIVKGGAFAKTGEFVFSLKSDLAVDAPNGIVVLDPSDPGNFSINTATILGPNPLIFIEDFSEDPLNEMMWAVQHYLDYEDNPDSSFFQNFNPHNCFATIDPFALTVDNGSYPPLENWIFSHGHITTMFHNPFNEFFGQRLTEVYQFDVDKNSVKKIKIDRVEHTLDGCSCPYTLKMRQTVEPQITYPCTEVIYNFTVANFTQNPQNDIVFKDTFPSDFEILEVIRNPFGGNISGLNSNELTISNMEIPRGIDSIQVRILLPEIVTGIFDNQAFLQNVDLNGTNDSRTIIPSDFPNNAKKNDPTPIEIIPFAVTVEGEDFVICKDSSIAIQPLELLDNLTLTWSTGSTDSILVVQNSGIYGVTVSAGCNADSAQFEVIESPFEVILDEIIEVHFGDSILVEPNIISLNPIKEISWHSIEPNIISCPDCLESFIHPKTDNWIWINALNSIGCKSNSRAYIRVKKDIFTPSAFSPNSDKINDFFYLQSKNSLIFENFQIFDRWGNLVFQNDKGLTNSPTDGWDGLLNGKSANSGVYIWKTTVTFNESEKIDLSGNLMIIR